MENKGKLILNVDLHYETNPTKISISEEIEVLKNSFNTNIFNNVSPGKNILIYQTLSTVTDQQTTRSHNKDVTAEDAIIITKDLQGNKGDGYYQI